MELFKLPGMTQVNGNHWLTVMSQGLGELDAELFTSEEPEPKYTKLTNAFQKYPVICHRLQRFNMHSIMISFYC